MSRIRSPTARVPMARTEATQRRNQILGMRMMKQMVNVWMK